MTREEIIDGLEIYTVGRLKKARVHITVEELQKFIDAIKSLEQEPCGDAISIPYLMHKEMDIPLSDCQKAYDVAIDYLRNQGKLKG